MSEEQSSFDFGEKTHDPNKPLFDPDEIRTDCLALIADGIAGDIEKLVEKLLGPVAAA